MHNDLDCRILSKKDFQTSFLGQEHLVANGCLLDKIQGSFSLFGTKMAISKKLSNIFGEFLDLSILWAKNARKSV